MSLHRTTIHSARYRVTLQGRDNTTAPSASSSNRGRRDAYGSFSEGYRREFAKPSAWGWSVFAWVLGIVGIACVVLLMKGLGN